MRKIYVVDPEVMWEALRRIGSASNPMPKVMMISGCGRLWSAYANDGVRERISTFRHVDEAITWLEEAPQEPLITAAECAWRLHRDKSRIYRWIEDGCPAQKSEGGWKVKLSEVMQWMKGRGMVLRPVPSS